MVRLCAVWWIVTSAGCSPGASAPRASTEPVAPPRAPSASVSSVAPSPQPAPTPPPPPSVEPMEIDESSRDALSIDEPVLTCGHGTSLAIARAPERTWYCAKPDGTRHGLFVTLFPDDTPEISGAYKDGQLDGAWQRRAPNGTVIETGSYAAGQKSGRWRMVSSYGGLLGEYEMKAGTGTERHWLDDGSLYRERALRAGVPHGSERIYSSDGALVYSAQWTTGKLHGPRLIGTRTTLRIEETLVNGVRRGNRQIWLFNDPRVEESYDRAGKRHGDYMVWRNRRTPRLRGQFEHGARDGLWTWTDRDGNKEREGNYFEGVREGPWTEWFENKIVSAASYEHGKPSGEFIYYDRNENELGRFEIKNGTGTLLTFWPNKRVASRQQLVRGAARGLYQELTNAGKLLVEGRYRDDRKHGVWREWSAEGGLQLEQSWKRGKLDGHVKKYVDGRIATQSTYRDGKAHGPYVEYRTGKPAVTGQYADDRRTGTWTTYDAEGQVTLISTYRDGVLDGIWKQRVDGAVLEGAMTQGRRTGTWTRTDKAGVVRQLTYRAL